VHGPLTIGELAEFLGVERAMLTRNLAVVEGEGWVDIRPGAMTPAHAWSRLRKKAAQQWRPRWQTGARRRKPAAAAIGQRGVNALHALARSV
jgi:DNA-binding FadR family transcriptional regulator